MVGEWKDMGIRSRYMALLETLAHLQYLELAHQVERTEKGGLIIYRPRG
jgi:hypothetical protein